jgi:hypothetical protein
MSKKLIAEFRLMDTCNNEMLLLVRRGDGEIDYSLSGKNGRSPQSLGNLSIKGNLLFADMGLDSSALVDQIREALLTGNCKVEYIFIVPDEVLAK